VITLHVQPRPTPAERAEMELEVPVDDDLGILAEVIEDWVSSRQAWELTLQEGHEFGKTNNVVARVLFVEGWETSSFVFRLDQLDDATDTGTELVLRFEEKDGIAKLARLKPNGMDVELLHILTFT
jgi:hypothetical protein